MNVIFCSNFKLTRRSLWGQAKRILQTLDSAKSVEPNNKKLHSSLGVKTPESVYSKVA